MTDSLRNELLSHAIATLDDRDGDAEDLHHYAFNEDYYLIGTWTAKQWLDKHNIDAFDAISEIIEWQNETFGESQLSASDITPEKIANLYVYLMGEQLLSEFYLDSEDLMAELKAELS